MGVLTDILIVDEGEAEKVAAASAPTGRWKGMAAKGLDQVKLAKLWALLEDRSPADEPDEEFTLLAQQSDEGPWVFRIPPALTELLARLDDGRVRSKARDWAAIEEFEADGWSGEEVRAALAELCGLAREATKQETSLLLWVSL